MILLMFIQSKLYKKVYKFNSIYRSTHQRLYILRLFIYQDKNENVKITENIFLFLFLIYKIHDIIDVYSK